MTFDETIQASKRLDAALKKARADLMPVTNAKNEIAGLKGLAQDIRNAVADVKQGVSAELAGMAHEIRENGALLIKKVQAERAEAMTEFNDMLGNERAGDTEQ